MIVRSKEMLTIEEKQNVSNLSLEYGKKAIMIDLKDSASWCIKLLIINRCICKCLFFQSFYW
jgi:hypothetical protein